MHEKQKNKGSVLAIMVLLILLLSLTCMALIGVAREARVRTVKNVSDLSARFAADAGFERALYLMNQNLEAGTWTLDDVPTYDAESLTASEADYTVTFEGDLDSGYQLTSVGACGLATRTVRATIELSSPFANDYAVLTKGNLILKNNAMVSGYNSADPMDTDVLVAIGTLSDEDGSIVLDNNATVNGDIHIPPGSDPDEVVKTPMAEAVAGEIFVLPTEIKLPPITEPSFTASKGAISGKDVTLTSSDSGKYTGIDISTNGRLMINGNVILYIVGDIVLGNQARLEVADLSTLKVYFNGDIEAKNASQIVNVSQIPDAIRLYGTGEDQTIDLKNSNDIQAIIYAPDADMIIYNSVDAYGCFIVDTFEMKSSGNVYYDEALKETSLDDELIYFTVTHWEEL